MQCQHPVTWQPSKDGDRLIGRILLNKRLKDGSVPRDSGAMLGLKVWGEICKVLTLCYFTGLSEKHIPSTYTKLVAFLSVFKNSRIFSLTIHFLFFKFYLRSFHYSTILVCIILEIIMSYILEF